MTGSNSTPRSDGLAEEEGSVLPKNSPGSQRSAKRWLPLILLLAFVLRLLGLVWGQGYAYFCQGDGIEAYSVAVAYSKGEPKWRYLGQPNFNEKSKLPGPLWTLFCLGSMRLWGSIEGVMLVMLLLNTVAVYLTWLLAEWTIGPPASLWAALLAATLPSTVFYSVGVYNPDITPFLSGLLFLALWKTIQQKRSAHIFWVIFLLFVIPQFHMAATTLCGAVAVVLILSAVPLSWPWLAGGLVAGGLLYLPYVLGEMAHGWENTLGMTTGKGGYTWDALKAVTTPLNFMVNWVPQWSRSPADYKEVGRACFGSFALTLAVNILSGAVAVGLTVAAVQLLTNAFRGFWRSPRQVFASTPGLIFVSLLLLVPLVAALVSGRPYHARYELPQLPALLVLVGAAATTGLKWTRWGAVFRYGLLITVCANIWFMPAFYHHQKSRIENGGLFLPSFRKLETVYQILKSKTGNERRVEIDDADYLRSLNKGDQAHRDIGLLRQYVNIREAEISRAGNSKLPPAVFKLYRSDAITPGDVNIAFQGNGIALVLQTEAKAADLGSNSFTSLQAPLH